MKTGLILASLCATTSAWTAPTPASSRRKFLDTAAKIVPLVIATEAFAEDEAAAPSEPVVSEAPAVEEPPPAPEINNENEFIEKLLKRSAANKEKNDASVMARDKLSKRGFSSQYDRPSFVGVHYKDSDKVDMILKEEFDKMLANGKVKQTYESKVSKKTGEISDDYAKPIFVFN